MGRAKSKSLSNQASKGFFPFSAFFEEGEVVSWKKDLFYAQRSILYIVEYIRSTGDDDERRRRRREEKSFSLNPPSIEEGTDITAAFTRREEVRTEF